MVSGACVVHNFKLVMRVLVIASAVLAGALASAQQAGLERPDAQVREPTAAQLSTLDAELDADVQVPADSGRGFGGTEAQAQADSEPPITDAEMRAIEDQLLFQQSALNAANERLAAIEQQLAAQGEQLQVQDASVEGRSVAANQQAQEEARWVRARQLEGVLVDLQAVQELIQAGEDDLDAPLSAAASALQTAANAAAVATPLESDHLVRAQMELLRVPGMMQTRNTQYASLAVLQAQEHAAAALALARAQQEVTR